MAHRNEIRRLLGSHHAGDLRDRQDIALGDLTPLNFFKRFWLEKDSSLSCCSPFGQVLSTDIDHPRSSRLIEVRKFCHFMN